MDSTQKVKRIHKSRSKRRKFHGNRYTYQSTADTSDSLSTGSRSRSSTNPDDRDTDSLASTSTPSTRSRSNSRPNSTSTSSLQMADPTRSSHEIRKSSSYQKLNKPDDTVTENSSLSGYRFINIEDLVSFINLFPCPSCGETKDNLFHINEQLTGINTKLTFECSMCKNISTFSHKENVNLRFQVAMYGIGCHENKGRRFLAAMDMPQPVSSVRAAVYKTRIHNATKQAADMSMKQAAEELQAVEATSEVTVSCDGTWQRRGFSSKNGISTCLSEQKSACKSPGCRHSHKSL